MHGSLTYGFGARTYDLASRTHIMGILNVTPDSFSDGGRYATSTTAVDRALAMVEEGADFIDVGGESTRPRGSTYGGGATPVSEEDELARVIPVIEEIVRRTDVPVSIDTYKSVVARRALAAGAAIVNDISGFGFDPAMPTVVGEAGASAVVMHIKGTPQTMQRDPVYEDLFGEIVGYLSDALARGRAQGVRQMMVDPGIGFGKTVTDNYRLLGGLSRFAALGVPVLVGPSRKWFIGAVTNLPVGERLEGTLAAVTACILNGANIVRVHDVREARRAAQVADAIRRPPV
ncbi:MAG: dihydropteroate synthase [Bacteroidota bacterium]